MDLDNQNSATNINTDSTAPNPSGPIDADKPSLDMDAINEAIVATNGSGSNVQTSFNVNDISLDNVPQSQDELNERLKANPEMSLAGGSGAVDVNPATSNLAPSAAGDNLPSAPIAPIEQKTTTPAATFVDGDIIDDTNESTEEEVTPDYSNINSDPLSNFESNIADPSATNSLNATANLVSPSPSTDTSADIPTAPTNEPAHVANAITAPNKKSKLPLIIGIIGVVLVIVAVIFFILTANKYLD